ncbi:hypothetical protein CsSME_00024809 [Camellia sinensis var. sinensis]
MDDNTDIQGDKQEETKEAEALSLSDFPITTIDDQSHSNDSISISKSKYEDHRSSSELTDFFEFFNNLTSEMSHPLLINRVIHFSINRSIFKS